MGEEANGFQITDDFELEEYVVLNRPRTPVQPLTWTRSMTLFLIELVRERTPMVPSKFKTIKAMYAAIAEDLDAEFGVNLSVTQVANKMKSLERAFKDVNDNNTLTGRKRKDFEFESEMSSIMSKRRNVNPLILVSDSAVEHEHPNPGPQGRSILVELPHDGNGNHPARFETVDEDSINDDLDQHISESTPLVTVGSSDRNNRSNDSTTPRRRIRIKKVTRVDVLQQIRKDRLKAMEKKSAVDERIAAALEQKNELEQKKIELLSKLIENVVPR